MQPRYQVTRKHTSPGLFGLVILIFLALLGLFAWQTMLFVQIIFPDQDLVMKILTVFSVDGMGFVWSCLHTFYKFAHPSSKTSVRWGWAITYLLSILLSISYMILTYMLHFNHVTDPATIETGIGASIGALIFNLAMLSIFLFYEISTRYPNRDEYEYIDSIRPRLVEMMTKDEITMERTAPMPAYHAPLSAPQQQPQKGLPGRKSTDEEYAKLWLKWQDTGFEDATCPWSNPAEFRNRPPKPEVVARIFRQ